ncbi:MAG: aldehyde dehydrogenase [Nitrososphaeria archaeon]
MVEKVLQYIDGKFVEGNGPVYDDINPATEEIITKVNFASKEQANEAVDAAFEAQKKWEKLPAIDRARYVQKVAQKIRERAPDLARLISLDMGKPLKEAIDEVNAIPEYLDYMAGFARRIEGEIIESDRPNENILLYYEPMGVVVGIIPWNYPLFVWARKFAPALVAGDSVVIKPAEDTPLIINEMSKIIDEVGIPGGVVNHVFGYGPEVGTELVKNKKVSMVSFTGSVETGSTIMKIAADNITKISLELGGKAPTIVMDDADLEKTANYVAASRLLNAGQVCNAAERLYLHEKIAERFLSLLKQKFEQVKLGNPLEESTTMGPLVNRDQLEKVTTLTQRALESGAKPLMGAKPTKVNGKGYYYLPTILVNVTNDMEIFRKEIFGPVEPVVTFKDLDEAIEMANDNEYGLTSSIFTQNLDTAMKAINSLKYGETYVNREHFEAIQGFHAGWRKSGIGGDDGKHGFYEFLKTHIVYLQYDLGKK